MSPRLPIRPVEAIYAPFPIYPIHWYTPSDIRGVIAIMNTYGGKNYIIVRPPIFYEGCYQGTMFSLYSTYSEQFSISYIINWDKLILDFSSESAHTSPYSVREARLTFSANGTLEEHGTEAYSEEELEYMHTLATAFHRGIQQEPPVIEEENDTLATVLPDMYPILHYVRNSRISDVFIRSVDNDELEQPESISAYVYYGLDDYLYRTYWGIEAEEHSLEKAGLMRWSTHQDLVFQPSAEFPYPAEFSCPIRGKDLPEEIQAIMSSLPLPKEFTVRQNAPSSWLHGEETKLEDTVLEDS